MHNSKSIKDRFLSKVSISEDRNKCWIWVANCNIWGYGKFNGNGAHRFSYELFNGPIPQGLFVLHKPPCFNRKCVNPDHLYLGTQQDNMNDMKEQERQRYLEGEELPQSKLTEENVLVIRHMWNNKKRFGVAKQSDLADMFGISQCQISMIVRNLSWKHI